MGGDGPSGQGRRIKIVYKQFHPVEPDLANGIAQVQRNHHGRRSGRYRVMMGIALPVSGADRAARILGPATDLAPLFIEEGHIHAGQFPGPGTRLHILRLHAERDFHHRRRGLRKRDGLPVGGPSGLLVHQHSRPAAVAAWLHKQGIARPGFSGSKVAVLHPVELSISGKESL